MIINECACGNDGLLVKVPQFPITAEFTAQVICLECFRRGPVIFGDAGEPHSHTILRAVCEWNRDHHSGKLESQMREQQERISVDESMRRNARKVKFKNDLAEERLIRKLALEKAQAEKRR
jgi:hypothetical protein